ncbi:hypothetical protein G7Y89_g2342 [Cudoniella acicularis]|uniref:Uncharacterized protein n=1 Tax=Cudoniella acicularis TaxID=354080 RepID=A0A8H4RTH6_9HELO|nr:hypothetical protein G7Y89_g2342 [Cudoniella acicularis]
MSRQEPNPFEVLGILPTIRLTPANVQRAYSIALSRVRQYANPVHINGQVKQYRMPYSEVELAVGLDFFSSPDYIDEANAARFHPTAIDSILTNMSGLTVLNYYSSWNPAASRPEQVIKPIPGWLSHAIHAFHRWQPASDYQKPRHRRDVKRTSRVSNRVRESIPSSGRLPLSRFSGGGTTHDPIILDSIVDEARLA